MTIGKFVSKQRRERARETKRVRENERRKEL